MAEGGIVSYVSPVGVGASRVEQGDSVGMRTPGGCSLSRIKAGDRCWQGCLLDSDD
jgi:hypothetical protein